MKISKKQLRKIINEEKAKILKEDVASSAQIVQKARELGYFIGGFPGLAKGLAAAFEENGRKEAADALMDAYKESQQELDLIYAPLD